MRGLLFSSIFLLFIFFQPGCQQGRVFVLPTKSMEPTIRKGQYVKIISKKVSEDFPKRWELVAYRAKQDEKNMFRVIGLPGEIISFHDGKYTINGYPLNPPPGLSKIPYEWNIVNPIGRIVPFPYTIPKNSYFLVGDNPSQSNDSRHHGAIRASDIIGEVHLLP